MSWFSKPKPEFVVYYRLEVGDYFRRTKNGAVYMKGEDFDYVAWVPDAALWHEVGHPLPHCPATTLTIPVEVRT